MHYVNRYLETLKVCSIRLQVASNLAGYFPGTVFPQPQECGARFIAVTNQSVPRPSTTFFTCSQADHFFLSTTWKYWRLSKRLGHGTHSQNRNAPNARNNTFSRIKCGKVWLQIFKFKYSIAKFLLVWLNQFNRAASTTETKSNSIFAVKFVERSNWSFSVYLTNQRCNYNSIELWNFNCVNISTRSEAIKISLQ